MSESLFQLTNELKDLMDLANDPNTDEQAFLDTLDGLTFEIGAKLDGYKFILDQLEGRRDTLKAAAKELTQYAESIDRKLKEMKSRAMEALEAVPGQELKGKVYTFKIVKNGGKLPLIIDGHVPDKYCKVTIEPDRQKIMSELGKGTALPLARWGERGRHLQIK